MECNRGFVRPGGGSRPQLQRESPREGNLRVFWAIIFAAPLLAACDIHKDERRIELQRLEAASAQLARVRGQIEDAERSISKMEIEVKEAREDAKANDSEYEKNKLELAKYAMDHKIAATAAAAGAAGVAALLSDLDQQQKAAIAVPTVFAIGYCVFNSEECAEVSTRIAYYGTQIALFKGKVAEARQRESAARSQMGSVESSRQSLRSQAADLSAQVGSLRERVQSLQCKFPVCF